MSGAGGGAAGRAGGGAASGGAQRKLVIRPLKRVALPADFEESSWRKLQAAVWAVQGKRAVSSSLEELYRAVEDLCLHKLGAKLYGLLQAECSAHVASLLAELATRTGLAPPAFLAAAQRTWDDHCSQMLLIRQIFLYLDRTYVLGGGAARSLFDMGLQLFREHLERHAQVEARVVEGLLLLVEGERSGDAVDRGLLKGLVRMLSSLGLYASALEPPLLQATDRFYAAEGDALAGELEVPAYLMHCERRLDEEYGRCDAYLEPRARKPLIAAVERRLLEAHVAALLDRGFDPLLAENRTPDLSRLYSLCARIGALEALRTHLKSHIRRVAGALVCDEEKEGELVPALLAMKARLDGVLAACFARNEAFVGALREGFEHCLNQRANKPAELLARYIDGVMRGGVKHVAGSGGSEEELEATLDACLVLFRLIQGKDVFEAFYKRDLAKRLLLGRSASADAEKACISKLKAECGAQFTNKLEGMFKDVALSADVMATFRGSSLYAAACSGAGLEVNVHVLTSGFWPSYPVTDCRLPPALATAQSAFRDFYLSKHTGRRLVWYNGLSTCVIKAQFDAGTRELSVSLLQATVLSLFNDSERLTLAEIAAGSGIEDRELRRTLQSLACGKERVLLKEPRGRDVGDGDAFLFNAAYTSRLYRVRINAIQLKETSEENKKTNESVLQDRAHAIDAAVVRIMKTRKTLSHKLLMAELAAQLRFPVRATDVKKRIESLVDREYLERDANHSDLYNYLA